MIFKTIQGLNALKMENIPIQSDIEGLDKVGYTNTIEALKVQVEVFLLHLIRIYNRNLIISQKKFPMNV